MFLLGFTDEHITGGWQHWRLATECGSAFDSENLPASFGVLEAPGEGKYLLYWYVQADAAEVLDRHGVHWRRFFIGRTDRAPQAAHPAMVAATAEQRDALAERRRVNQKMGGS